MKFQNILLPHILILNTCYIIIHATDEYTDDVTGLAFNDYVYYDSSKLGTEYIKGYGFAGPISFYTTNFTTMLTYSHMFIDKSLFIKAILETPGDSDILITCPRRWGKSINLLMLRLFLEIQVHPNGTIIQPRKETTNYKLFKKGRVNDYSKLRHPLRISKHRHLFDQYQGQWPVIHLQPYFLDIEDEQDFEKQIKQKISEIYEEHTYMLKVFEQVVNGSEASEKEKSRAQTDYDTFKSYLSRQCSRYDIKHSITFLSRVLAQHFNQKVYVLIDSYDDLISYLYSENTCGNEEQMGEFYREFLKYSLRERAHIRRFVLTGIANIELFRDPSVTHMLEHNLLNTTLTPFFGYSEREMELIFDYANISQPQRVLIKTWCNRYRYGSTPSLKIYHPLSVNIYLACKSFDYFYEPKLPFITKTIGLFINMPKFEDMWCALLTGTRYNLDLHLPDFTYEHLVGIEKAIVEHTDPTLHIDPSTQNAQDPIDTALYLYLLNGYLTWGRHHLTPQGITRISVKIANKETTRRLKTFTATYYAENCFGITFANISEHAESVDDLLLTFIESGYERGLSFEAAYETFLNDAPSLAVMDDRRLAAAANLSCHCSGVREYIRSSLLCMFAFRESFEIHCLRVLERSHHVPDIFMTRGNVGVVIQIYYDRQNTVTNLSINTSYAIIFNQSDYFSHINEVKFISMRIYPNKSIETRSRSQVLR